MPSSDKSIDDAFLKVANHEMLLLDCAKTLHVLMLATCLNTVTDRFRIAPAILRLRLNDDAVSPVLRTGTR